MFDSVDVTQIPRSAAAVAGYVGGRWPTYQTLLKSYPSAHVLGIAVFASEDAECLDIEQGDATIAEAASWVKRQVARGVAKPVCYTSLSQAASLLAALKAAGVQRNQIRLWTAHYNYTPHLCSSACGLGFTGTADATQYTDKAMGRNLDASLVSDGFFPAPKPAPTPPPPPRTPTGVTPAPDTTTLRAQLRALILYWANNGGNWTRIMKTHAWKLYRNLGGK